MSQRERPAFRRPREADLERLLRPEYREYEEWRVAQTGASQTEDTSGKKEQPKGFRLGRMDIIFVLLGVLAGLMYQSCKAAQ